jgi:hypothetical protein
LGSEEDERDVGDSDGLGEGEDGLELVACQYGMKGKRLVRVRKKG